MIETKVHNVIKLFAKPFVMTMIQSLNLMIAALLRSWESHFTAIFSVCLRNAYYYSSTENYTAGLNAAMF